MEALATALPALSEAFALILQPEQIAFLVVGVLLGLSVGVFPGLGGIAGLSLVLPFIYGMDEVSGLALMVGLVAVIPTSDTFASVLMGIPGSSASQATVLDGFPLAKRGQAARALAAAFISSLIGGLFGAIVLTFFVLIARPLVLAFGTPELLMVTILGLAMVGTLAGRIPLKGVAAAGLGMMVGSIGAAPALGSGRLVSAEWPYLYDGLQLVIVGLGIFAIPEIIALLRQDRSISRDGGLGAGWLQGLADWWHHKWLSLRCAVIGVIVGVIPGLGGSVVDWIAYGHTVQTSRKNPEFGSGDIRGVIGPESSNNAKEGGGLVPTLLFGIPGSGSMAVFIGGLILLGYEAGPQMITNNLDITYTIVWSLALANVVGAGLCIGLSQPIARLTTIRFTLLVPFLFMLIAFAAFQSRQSLEDLAALAAIGLLGIFMRRFDWSRPAFLIGFVLADQAEVYTYQAAQIAMIRARRGMGEMFDFLFSPIVIAILIITIVSVWLGIRQAKAIMPEGDIAAGKKLAPLSFAMLIAAFFTWSLIDALGISVFNDKVFPATISAVALLATLVIIVRMLLSPADSALFADREVAGEDAEAAHGLWPTLAWFLSLLVLTSLFGFIIAIALFFLIFLRARGGLAWQRIFVLTGAGLGFILTMASLLNRDFPPGLLQHYIDLPWPLN